MLLSYIHVTLQSEKITPESGCDIWLRLHYWHITDTHCQQLLVFAQISPEFVPLALKPIKNMCSPLHTNLKWLFVNILYPCYMLEYRMINMWDSLQIILYVSVSRIVNCHGPRLHPYASPVRTGGSTQQTSSRAADVEERLANMEAHLKVTPSSTASAGDDRCSLPYRQLSHVTLNLLWKTC